MKLTIEELVDQTEYGKNTCYLTDFLQITHQAKMLNSEEIRDLFVNHAQSAAQIAKDFGVAKTVILLRLHGLGVAIGTAAPGRMTSASSSSSSTGVRNYQRQQSRKTSPGADSKIAQVESRGITKQFRASINVGTEKFETREHLMKELISVAVLVATMYGGIILGEQILQSVRDAALTKSVHGLPPLSNLSRRLTSRKPTTRSGHVENR